MIIERQELLNLSAELHRRLAELEGENTALAHQVDNLKRTTSLDYVKTTEGECHRLLAENQVLRERIEKAEAACAEMCQVCETAIAALEYEWKNPVQTINRLKHALSTDCGQPLLAKLKAMEGILDDVPHESRHSGATIHRTDDCIAGCPACRWEAMKEAKP